MSSRLTGSLATIALLCASQAQADAPGRPNVLTQAPIAVSVLDLPVNFAGQSPVLNPGASPISPPGLSQAAASPVIPFRQPESPEELRETVAAEQAALRQRSRQELEQRAALGQRGAQVALAEDYAREAALLAFAPAAANDAYSDALRFYNLAASRGFPGAPSLDMAGVKVYPIRAQR